MKGSGKHKPTKWVQCVLYLRPLSMDHPRFQPPWYLRNGLFMTVYTSIWGDRYWQQTLSVPYPAYTEHIFSGAQGIEIYGWMAQPAKPQGTIIATYGITGELANQWSLQILGCKAVAQDFAVVLFDWRAHGKTADLSPVLTSDGLFEGEDFVRLAAEAKSLGCPPPYWFCGYSLSGQLALWGGKTAQTLHSTGQLQALGLSLSEIGGVVAISPSLESERSLTYLVQAPLGRFLEKKIASELHQLAQRIQVAHPGLLDPAAIQRARSIWTFDQELVIAKLGLATVEEYYQLTSPLYFLADLTVPTLIIYAKDDPMFDPTLIHEIATLESRNPAIDLILTQYGGHACYLSSSQGQSDSQDSDPWWAWNRMLQWLRSRDRASTHHQLTEFS